LRPDIRLTRCHVTNEMLSEFADVPEWKITKWLDKVPRLKNPKTIMELVEMIWYIRQCSIAEK